MGLKQYLMGNNLKHGERDSWIRLEKKDGLCSVKSAYRSLIVPALGNRDLVLNTI